MSATDLQSKTAGASNGLRLGFLDSVRGLMAVWVMLGHISTAVGATLPIIKLHPTGVDIFIILSGFLMVYNYNLRCSAEPWESFSTWRSFWIRRFFRIAPVYYVCFTAVWLLGPLYIQWQHSLAVQYQHPWMIDPLSPSSPVSWNSSISSLLAHLTFLFGVIPSLTVTSPLPDWSLGLEMQYYAVFPLVMLLWKRGKWLPLAVGIYAVGYLSKHLLGLGMGEGGSVGILTYTFPMASFLGFKISVFLIGMLLAEAVFRVRNEETEQAAILMGLAGVI